MKILGKIKLLIYSYIKLLIYKIQIWILFRLIGITLKKRK